MTTFEITYIHRRWFIEAWDVTGAVEAWRALGESIHIHDPRCHSCTVRVSISKKRKRAKK